MYMLDTDICSYIIRMRPLSVLDKFNQLGNSDLCISVITQSELIYDAERLRSQKITRSVIENFTSRLLILNWDTAAAKSYGCLRASMEASGSNIGNMDLMIAAHALSINATIVTNNIRHFSMVENLQIENWV